MDNKSSADISVEIDQVEQELLDAEKNRDTLDEAITQKRRDIDLLRVSIRDLENSLIKAKCLVREKRHEKELLSREFWRARNSGL
jgi:septal ring factor EnvC (AmiA/AmiB activator)